MATTLFHLISFVRQMLNPYRLTLYSETLWFLLFPHMSRNNRNTLVDATTFNVISFLFLGEHLVPCGCSSRFLGNWIFGKGTRKSPAPYVRTDHHLTTVILNRSKVLKIFSLALSPVIDTSGIFWIHNFLDIPIISAEFNRIRCRVYTAMIDILWGVKFK